MVCKPTTLGQKYGNFILTNDSPQFDLTFTDLLNRQTSPIERFDRQRLATTSNALNRTFGRVDLTSYPFLESRVAQGPIIYPELGDFLIQTGYGSITVETIVTEFETYTETYGINPVTGSPYTFDPVSPEPNIFPPTYPVPTEYKELLEQLEGYYSENIANTISGGFCGAFSNPFDQILKIVGQIQLGVDLLSKLANFSLDDLFNKLDVLKDKLLSIVDGLKDKLLKQIDNIVDRITGMNSQFLFKTLQRKINNTRTFFENFSLDALKGNIEKFINDAVAQFEELTPEAISLLMFRFCQFAELIQSFMQSPVSALNSQVENFASQYETIQRRGLERTSSAVRSGATRLSPTGVAQGRRDQYAAAKPADPVNQPAIYNPELTAYENQQLSKLTDAGFPGYFRFGPGVTQMHNRRGVVSAYPGAGYLEVNREVWQKLTIVARELRVELLINSAYRSPKYNASLGGSATKSLHISGEAIDVNMGGLSDAQIRRFIALSSAVGFGGIGGYGGSNPSFIHVDIGGRRIWGSNNSRSSAKSFKFANELFRHERNEFSGTIRATTEQVDIDEIGPQ